MYNGIGLQTPRGSGTNGYIQTSKFFVRPKTGKVAHATKGYEAGQGTGGITKKPNKDILEHDRKRQIHLKLVVLEDKLIEQGYTDAEISEKLDEARRTLEAASASEDNGGSTATVVSDAKVSDTQSHQIAARKEKQMETLRAALGIGVSELSGQDAEEVEDGLRTGRKTDDRKWVEKREHAFLDREFRQKKDVADDLKVEKDGKKKSGKSVRDKEREEGEIDDSRPHKEEHRKRRQRDDSSDTDTSVSEKDRSKKHAKGPRRKHHKSKQASESDTETDSDDWRKHRKSKKSKKSRRYDSDSSDSGSETDSESDKKETSVEQKLSKKNGDDSDNSSSDIDDIGKFNSKREVDKYEKSYRRHDSNSGDAVKANSKHKGDKYEKSRRHHDSDDDSGHEFEVSKHKSEAAKQHLKTRRHDSEDDSDVDDRWKGDDKGGKSSKNRYRDDESDSDTGGRDKRRLTKPGCRSNDTDIDSDSDNDGKSGRNRRHDGEDEGYERQRGKKDEVKQALQQKVDSASYESSDDKSSSSSDSDSSDSDYKHRKTVKKNHADEKRGKAAHSGYESSPQKRDFRSHAVGNDDRSRAINDDERSALSNERYQSKKDAEKAHFDSRDMRNRRDRSREDQRVSKSNNRSDGNEEHHDRDLRRDDKFEAELRNRSYHKKDKQERDNYTRSGRYQGRDRNVEDDSRTRRKDDEPSRESRGSRDYELHRAERREGRRYQRDEEEDDKTAKRLREDAEQLYGSRRRARLEEEDQGSKDHEGGNSKRTRYNDSRSSERRQYEDEKHIDDRSRYRG